MFEVALAEEIWTAKYRFKTRDGEGDGSFEETAERVARAVAEAEASELRDHWKTRFRDAIADMRFIPAGRVLAGAGTDRSVTLFNCFVMGTIPDSLDGIFEHLKQAALTMQQGGGVGMDFSTIRPAGSPVHGVGADASVVLVEYRGKLVGVAVDEVTEVLRLRPDEIDPPGPEHGASGVITGVGHSGDSIVIILDIHSIIQQVML